MCDRRLGQRLFTSWRVDIISKVKLGDGMDTVSQLQY
jgi:hypothetical protein